MNDNLPILYQNIMFGLPSDFARDAFLWAVDLPGEDRMCYRAEAFAREANMIRERSVLMLDMAARILRHQKGLGTGTHAPDLVRFILTRHANWCFGGNLKPNYLEAL